MSRHLRDGIHDHHRAACRTDEERQRIEDSPLHVDDVHFEDERCWVVDDEDVIWADSDYESGQVSAAYIVACLLALLPGTLVAFVLGALAGAASGVA